MKIIIINNKEELDNFVGSQTHSQFIQSWAWGEFQQKVSGQVWRVGVEENGELLASAKIIKKSLPMGKSYFYCGRGPIFAGNKWNREAAVLLFEEIKRLARNESIMFLRFDPSFDFIEDFRSIINGSTFIQTSDVQPKKTLVLDLSKSEGDLLKEMHQKTRYNIKLAEKKSVKVVEYDYDSFENFWKLLDQTSDRDKFRPHGRSYYEEMLKLDNYFLKLFFAEFNGKQIATGVFSFFGDIATYLHGGSANDDREVMAPYALQWHVIRMAKESGCRYYDFHGIDEEKWPGVTRFKKGFGGEEVDYPGTYDLIYDESWYSIYKMVRKVRRSF